MNAILIQNSAHKKILLLDLGVFVCALCARPEICLKGWNPFLLPPFIIATIRMGIILLGRWWQLAIKIDFLSDWYPFILSSQ